MKRSIARDRRPRKRAVALLSGGLDSTVSLTLALAEVDVLSAVTFRYGQRAADEEIRASRRIARALGVPHRVIRLPWLGRLRSGALLDASSKVPRVRDSDLDAGPEASRSRAVWVPNRNGVFLNITASLAEAWGAEVVVGGFNREEARNFPDNGPEFVRAVNRSLKRSTLNGVQVVSYVQEMTKREMVEIGAARGAPLAGIYSCYLGGPTHCGRCESCRRLSRAFRSAGRWPLIRPRFVR